MPRRSSAGRSAPRAAPRSATVRNPPQPGATQQPAMSAHSNYIMNHLFPQASYDNFAHQPPPPAPVQQGGGSVLGGIGSTIAEGMAWGVGSSVGHRVVDAVVGPRTIQHETVVTQAAATAAPMSNAVGADACGTHSKAFQDCINNYGSDISKCQFYLDMLNECRRGSGATLSA